MDRPDIDAVARALISDADSDSDAPHTLRVPEATAFSRAKPAEPPPATLRLAPSPSTEAPVDVTPRLPWNAVAVSHMIGASLLALTVLALPWTRQEVPPEMRWPIASAEILIAFLLFYPDRRSSSRGNPALSIVFYLALFTLLVAHQFGRIVWIWNSAP